MKRVATRILGVILGLTVGWYVAGVVTSPALTNSAAAQTDHVAGADAPNQSAGAEAGQSAESNQEEVDHGQQAARLIAPDPGHPEQIAWFGWVIAGIIVLFVAALVLGYPTLKLQPPPPADPPSHDDHSHGDDHGHDDHGDAHEDAHGHGEATHGAGSHA